MYDERLKQEINADRIAHDKKPLTEKDETATERTIAVSSTDPDCGLFHKGGVCVYSTYGCDKHNFVLEKVVKAGNVHDSTVFDEVYDEVTEKFREVETVAVDAGYKTPWICKKVIDDGKEISAPYKRPMTKKGFFKSYEFVYNEL